MIDQWPAITVITGGIGGAKLVGGLAKWVPAAHLSIIGNVGDDDEFHGLWVSPDIDILTYTLAGRVDRGKGWGINKDSFNALDMLHNLGQETWMQLGDKDLAVHMYRSMRRRQGHRPFTIAADIATALGVTAPILLPTDDVLQTQINSALGLLSMEEYFVREQCKPAVYAVEFLGANTAQATPEALQAIDNADILIIAPSNPVASIGPTLSIQAIRAAIENTSAYRVAMSPIIGGKAVKGPSCEMLTACGYKTDVFGVLDYYTGLIDAFIIDTEDRDKKTKLAQSGVEILCQNILMRNASDRPLVAKTAIDSILSQVAVREGKHGTC